MDHTYDAFEETKKVDFIDEKLSESDDLMAKMLSASDYLCDNDLENAFEVLLDINEITELKEEKEN